MSSLRHKSTAERHAAREDALRPCRVLGYDRDRLGVYLLERKAYDAAESQFRRAVWVNPYEDQFKFHLALCLHRQGNAHEAWAWVTGLTASARTPEILELIDSLRAAMGTEDKGNDPHNE